MNWNEMYKIPDTYKIDVHLDTVESNKFQLKAYTKLHIATGFVNLLSLSKLKKQARNHTKRAFYSKNVLAFSDSIQLQPNL